VSKYSDNRATPLLAKAGGGTIQPKTFPLESGVATVITVIHDERMRSTGEISCQIARQDGSLIKIVAAPVHTHNFICPVPNEKVYCFKDSTNGDWFYFGPLTNRGLTNHTGNGDHATYDQDGSLFHGEYFVAHPDSSRCIDVLEGDLVLQSRFGSTLRMSHTNGKVNTPWNSNKTETTTPIVLLRTGYLPVESLQYDQASIYLTTDQMIDIPIKTPFPSDVPNKDYNLGQLILYSDRIVAGSRTDNILLSSAKNIHLSTQNWNHDVDEVLDTMTELISEVKALASEVGSIAQSSITQTFTVVSLGSTLPSTMAGSFASNYSNVVNSQTKLAQIEQKLEALKQK